MQATYKILFENLSKLFKLVGKQNKRAGKLGLAPIIVTAGLKEAVTNEDGITVDEFISVTIDGQSPKLEGWEFVATLQHGEEGNILRVVPGFEGKLPEEFRTSDPSRCDHCKMFRRRNDTFVVRKQHDDIYGADPTFGREDRWAFFQVGRNCLADFVGSEKVHAYAALAEMMSLISEACEGYGERLGGGSSHLDLEASITWAAQATLLFGWVSRSKAEEWGKSATADIALAAMDASRRGERCSNKCYRDRLTGDCKEHWVPGENAVEFTQKALEWAPGWIERELGRSESDYIWNMKVVLANDVIPVRSFALAASVLGAYQREMERKEKIEREAANTVSEWVGMVGEKAVLTLTSKAVRYIDTDWGVSTLVTYHTPEGAVVKWFASGERSPELEKTATYEVTIKKHVEYNGIKETHVIRVKPYFSPEDKKALAKRRKEAKTRYQELQKASEAAWIAASEAAVDSPLWNEYNEARDAANVAHREWQEI